MAAGAARAELTHSTIYRYERPVRLGPQLMRLRPLPDPRRPEPDYALVVEPEPLALHWQMDPAGNMVARMILPQPIEVLSLLVTIGLDMTPRNPFHLLLDPAAERWPFRYDSRLADALLAYRWPDHAGPALERLVASTAGGSDTLAFVLQVAAAVRDQVGYVVRMEAGVLPVEQTLSGGQGSCRDSAWALVQALRLHGVAARFVSGYLVQAPESCGEAAPAEYSAELHAWAEAYLPGAGWVGLDATSGLLTAEGHVALAASADVAGAAPLSGTVEAAGVVLETSVQVRRIGSASGIGIGASGSGNGVAGGPPLHG